MMPSVEFRYTIGDIVEILPIGGAGRVLGQRCFGQGQEYNVRYFNNGEEKSIWFFENELKAKNNARF